MVTNKTLHEKTSLPEPEATLEPEQTSILQEQGKSDMSELVFYDDDNLENFFFSFIEQKEPSSSMNSLSSGNDSVNKESIPVAPEPDVPLNNTLQRNNISKATATDSLMFQTETTKKTHSDINSEELVKLHKDTKIML